MLGISSALQVPLLDGAPLPAVARRMAWCFATFGAAVGWLAAMSLYWLASRSTATLSAAAGVDDAPLLVFGKGGAYWSNGTRALTAAGQLSWACRLQPSARHPAGALAFVSEDTGVIAAWRPGERVSATASLSRLRAPVACVQHGALLFVACFGVEGAVNRSGIAVLDVDSWELVSERPLGVHVHNLYPAADGRSLFVADVGDPWVSPPVKGGLFRVAIGPARPGTLGLVRGVVAGEPVRLGPPLFARAAAFPPSVVGLPSTVADSPSQPSWRRDDEGRDDRDGDGADPSAGTGGGAGNESETALVISQEPFGEPSQVHALRGDWSRLGAAPVSVQSVRLPLPPVPSDGAADIFRVGGRIFATDRYLGRGRIFELDRRDLSVRSSAPLGAHPRYTAPLGHRGPIVSVSRDDGRLTTLDLELREIGSQPSGAPLPSFVIAWPAKGG